MAIAAAAKLPTCFTSEAALPVAEAPPAELEALAPDEAEAPEVCVPEELPPVVVAVELPVAVAVAV